MFEEELKELCRKLKPLIGKRADALWTAYLLAETPEAKREIQMLIQMLANRHLEDGVDDQKILLPPPASEVAGGEFFLGHVLYRNEPHFPLYLRSENFIKHIGIFSITGAGKTNAAQTLLLGLLAKNIPFLVLDWKRSYRALLTLRHPEVSRIRVYSVGRRSGSMFSWNPLRAPPGVHQRTWISVVAEVLEKSHISGQGSGHVFMELLDKIFENSGFYQGSTDKFPNFFDANEQLQKEQFKGRKMLWQDTCLRILATFCFGPAAGAFNARHPMKLEELLEQAAIIELDQELPKPLRVFFSEIILRWIHLYRLAQGETDELRHVTILEEVHNMFPKTNIEKQAGNSLENVFREIRGFGEGLVNITQHPSLLPVYILGNCNTQIYLALQHEDDILTAKHALFLKRGDEVFLDKLKVGEGIIKIKGRIEPCHIRFPLVPIKKGSVSDDFTAGGDRTPEESLD